MASSARKTDVVELRPGLAYSMYLSNKEVSNSYKVAQKHLSVIMMPETSNLGYDALG